MTDLERKLAEALRGQAEEVTPNLDAAWAEQQRRQHRPRRRRLTVVIAPLAAVLVVLTSVLLATQLNTASAPPANPGQALKLATPVYEPMAELLMMGTPVALTEFAGQTDRWRAWAFTTIRRGEPGLLFCVAAMPADLPFSSSSPQFGPSPRCVPFVSADGKVLLAGYIGENFGPLPPDKAVYLLGSTTDLLRLYDAKGDLSQGRWVGRLANTYQLFVADVAAGSPPVRFEVS